MFIETNFRSHRKPDVVLGLFFASVREVLHPEVEQLLLRLNLSLVEPLSKPIKWNKLKLVIPLFKHRNLKYKGFFLFTNITAI
jgi:hypothetical protein